MPRTAKSEAIVLNKRNLPTQDLIITLFTQENGKQKILVKGVKKISSKRLPHLQTGNIVKIVIYDSQRKLYLQETTLISGFSTIKNNPKRLSFLFFYFHVLDRILPENQQELDVYKGTKHFLIDLAKSTPTLSLLEKHLNILLKRLGYLDKNLDLEELHYLLEELMNEKIPLIII